MNGTADDRFIRGFVEARRAYRTFYGREGHGRVPKRHVEHGFRLGPWCHNQRYCHRKGLLTQERIALFETLPGWVWYPRDAAWNEKITTLRRFVDCTGHARVPSDHQEQGFALGHWVAHIRHAHRLGQLTPDRICELESVPGWAWDIWPADPGEPVASEHATGIARRLVSRVQAIVAANPTDEVGAEALHLAGRLDLLLAVMEEQQKRARSRPRSPVAARRTRPRCRTAGQERRWQDGYAALLAYADREGHARVPFEYAEGSLNLGTWVSARRPDFRLGRLSPERVTALEAVPGWVWKVPRAKNRRRADAHVDA